MSFGAHLVMKIAAVTASPYAVQQPMNDDAVIPYPPPVPNILPFTSSMRVGSDRQWLRTVGYAGIESAGKVRQAEIGIMSDGTLAARVPAPSGRGHWIYDDKRLTLEGKATPGNYEMVAQRVRELIRHGAISNPIVSDVASRGFDALSGARITAQVMQSIRKKMMPGTGLWLQAFQRSSGLDVAHQRFVKAQTSLDEALKQYGVYPDAPRARVKLDQAFTEAVLATAGYLKAGGESFQHSARREVQQLSDLVRQLTLVAATALLGPKGGILQALGTRAFDRLTPGPRMYSSTGVDDLTTMMTVLAAIKAGDLAHFLAEGARVGTAGRTAIGTLLHFLADSVTETGGRVVQGLLNGETAPELWRNARAAFTGSGLASVVSSLTVQLLEERTKIPKAQLVAWAESLERVFGRLGVHVSTNQADIRPEGATGGQAPGSGPSAKNITVFDLLRIEASQRAPMYDDKQVPGLDFLRKVQSAAVGLDIPGVLPASGVLESAQDVAIAIWAVLESKKTDAEKQAFMNRLLEGQ